MAHTYLGLMIALSITALPSHASDKKSSFSLLSALSLVPQTRTPQPEAQLVQTAPSQSLTQPIPSQPPMPSAEKKNDATKKFNPLDILAKDMWPLVEAFMGHYSLQQEARVVSLSIDPWSPIISLAWNPKENSFISGDDKGRVCIWDVKTTQRPTGKLDHRSTIYSIDYSPDATRLITSGVGSLQLWDLNEKKFLHTLYADRSARRAVFDREGAHIASGGPNHLRIFDLQQQKSIVSFEDEKIIDVLWLNNEPTVVCALNWANEVLLVDSRTKKTIKKLCYSTIVPPSQITASSPQIACSSDDNRIMFINQNNVILWDRKADKAALTIIPPGNDFDHLVSIHLSKDNQKMLVSTLCAGLQMFDTQTGACLESNDPSPSAWIRSVVWSSDERHIVIGDDSGTIRHLAQPSLLNVDLG